MSDPADPEGIDLDPAALAAWIASGRALALVDVREPYEREAGHIAGSRHVPMNDLSAQAATFDAGEPVVLYCRVGGRSEMAAQALRAAGFRAYSMTGGLLRWASEGRPLSPDGGTVAEH
jgi:rhodanese-related sulfurtransferase